MATWPTVLPQSLLINGYGEQRQSEVIRSEMDSGPAKQRRRFSASFVSINGDILVNSTQLSELDDFIRVDLLGGSLPFSWVHPRTGADVTMRFTGPYTLAPISHDLFKISMNLEILP